MKLSPFLILFFMFILSAPANVLVRVHPFWGGEALQPGSIRYETAKGECFSISRVSYLVSEIALQRTDGSWVEQTNSVHWLDAEASRDSFELNTPSSGEFIALRFSIGLPPDLNHAKTGGTPAGSPLNPNVSGLHWSWQGEYIFMALEGQWRNPQGVLDGWSFHLARDANLTRIVLPVSLKPTATHGLQMDIDLDLGNLFRAPAPISFVDQGSSTHSREGDPIPSALTANLAGAFRVKRVTALTASESAAVHPQPIDLPTQYTPYVFQMSELFPMPELPRDNPLIQERVELGRKLFFDTNLSINGKQSCSTCHRESNGNAEPLRVSIGAEGSLVSTGSRNAMALNNLAWKNSFFWDGRSPSLRNQSLQPIQNPIEMHETLSNVVAKLSADSAYRKPFSLAFGSGKITPENISLALEQYLLTLVSFDSKWDRVLKGQAVLTSEEQSGFQLFSTEYDPRRQQYGADCFHCHGGILFQSQTFANNGLDATFTGPRQDKGRGAITGNAMADGKFAVPSLRNVEITGPYMHDGRFQTLEEVVEHYTTGLKRSATLDPNLAKHPDGGVPLSAEDKKALVAFLKTLTDFRYKTTDVTK